MMEENKIKVIKPDAVIVIKFDRDFYQRLTFVLRQIIEDKTPEQMQEAAKQMNENNITDLWVANYQTMLFLLKGSEDYCEQNNLTEMKDISEMRPSDENQPSENKPSDETQ
jgi:hypothetical protein